MKLDMHKELKKRSQGLGGGFPSNPGAYWQSHLHGPKSYTASGLPGDMFLAVSRKKQVAMPSHAPTSASQGISLI